jgi:hypothetical protein
MFFWLFLDLNCGCGARDTAAEERREEGELGVEMISDKAIGSRDRLQPGSIPDTFFGLM